MEPLVNRPKTKRGKATLERILTAAERLRELKGKAKEEKLSSQEEENAAVLAALTEKYEAAMDDDFNTADAISALFEMVKLANSTASEESSLAYVDLLLEKIDMLCQVMGILTERKKEALDQEVEDLIAKRQAARKERNFALADEIRGKLLEMGIVLEDTREGVKWKRV